MSLKIYTINVQGLKQPKKKVSLIKFISKFSPSVICIQETNLNTITDPKLLIPNYSVLYNSATTRSSGTAIFVSNVLTIESHVTLVPAKLHRITVKSGPKLYSIYNIHMPHVNSEAIELIDKLKEDVLQVTNSMVIL